MYHDKINDKPVECTFIRASYINAQVLCIDINTYVLTSVLQSASYSLDSPVQKLPPNCGL